jgi:hypothetical protein
MFEPFGGQPGVGTNEDVLVMASHTVTHMDALCHIYYDGSVYNGFPHGTMRAYGGAHHCGIEKSGGVVTRGVLVDVAAHKGVRWLDPGYVITVDDMQGRSNHNVPSCVRAMRSCSGQAGSSGSSPVGR